MKKQTTVREWRNNETLTETEGRVLEASRLWTRAETDRKLWADLEVQEVVVELLLTARNSKHNGKQALLDDGVQMGLTAKEIVAFQTVAKFWKREAKANRKSDKARRKAERVARAGEGAA